MNNEHKQEIERKMKMENELESVLRKMQDALEALREAKPEERGEQARRIQIVITDYEKLIAYYMAYVFGGAQ